MECKPFWLWLLELWLILLLMLMAVSVFVGTYIQVGDLAISLYDDNGINSGMVISFFVAAVSVIVTVTVMVMIYRRMQQWIMPYIGEYAIHLSHHMQKQALMDVAMRRVDLRPDRAPVVLNNTGFLCYRTAEDKMPKFLQANGQIPLETCYLRPFVELEEKSWLEKKIAHQVEFEVWYRNRDVIFSESQTHDIRKSKSLIIAKNWLDVSQIDKKYPWSIRVRVDGKLLAIHLFEWSKFSTTQVGQEALNDGEISQKLQRLVEKSDGLTGMSLDELLAENAITQ